MTTDANTSALPEKKIAEAEIVQREFADVDRYHLVKGLFQIMGGSRKPDPVEIRIELPNNGYLEVNAIKPLRSFDLVLLCTVVCKAAQDKKIIRHYTENKIGQELRNQLELLEDAATAECLAYETSARQLTEDMGLKWAGKKSLKNIEDSLKRLFMTSFALKLKKNGNYKFYLFRLMSHVKLVETRDIRMAFGLNVILAAALLTPGHYARIDMETLKSLEQAQQLMFVALCNAIDEGKKRKFTPEELREFIYGPKPDKIAKSTFVQQTSRTKSLTENLVNFLPNWEYEEKGKVVWIKRPYQKGRKLKRKSKKSKAEK